MEKYYAVYCQPMVPGFMAKLNEEEYKTEEEATAAAEAITNENPLIKTEVWSVEEIDGALHYKTIKTFCRVRFY